MQIVRPVYIVAAGVPLIEIDAPEVDQPEQRRPVVDHGEVHDFAVAVIDRADADPWRTRRRRLFHEERRARCAVWIAPHDHRAIADVRQQHRRDIGVVLNQRALGDAELGPERLAKVGQPHFAAVDLQNDVVDPRWNRHGVGSHRPLGSGALGVTPSAPT